MVIRVRRSRVIAGVIVVAMSYASSSVAQTSTDHDNALAEFREARRLIDAGDCTGALPHLQRSVAFEPSVGARMSLAECLEGSEPVRAWRALADAAVLAYTNHDDRLPLAEARALQLERRLPTVHLGLTPADLDRPGLEVRVDGRPIDRFLLRRGIVAVEPGPHHVEATAPDRGSFSSDLEAPAPGGSVLLPITLPPRPPPVAPVVETKTILVPMPVDEARLTRRTIGFAVGAVGLAGLGIGAAFGLAAFGRASELDELCNNEAATCRGPTVDAVRVSGRNLATASTATFIAGGVLLGAGVTLVVWPSKRTTESAPAPMQVRLSPTGLGLGGAF